MVVRNGNVETETVEASGVPVRMDLDDRVVGQLVGGDAVSLLEVVRLVI